VKVPPLLAWRIAVVALGLVAATLLVRALDRGLSGGERPLSGSHLAFGSLLALTVMPGPLLGFFATPRSGVRLRGLAVGGAATTAFAALLGGAFLAPRLFGPGPAGLAEGIAFAWCALALPLAAADFLRLRRGDPSES
jgi:hypothetical protein